MSNRIISMTPSQLTSLSKQELLSAILNSEGRTLACETIGITQPHLGLDVTNAEFASAMGGDMILLNMFDVQNPVIQGLPKVEPKETVRELKRLTGRMIGINLEPVDKSTRTEDGDMWAMSAGRYATVENAILAHEMGIDMLVLTGNPGNKVDNEAIASSVREISQVIGDKIVLTAGKMHASGVVSEGGENIITKEDIKTFAKAGADVILLPAPGTVPGITTEYIRELVSYSHQKELLTITSVGTSQEGADTDTIKRIALECKMTGTDIHHLGDAGYLGMALPENIMAYSIAIRGIRHTYFRMAQSLGR